MAYHAERPASPARRHDVPGERQRARPRPRLGRRQPRRRQPRPKGFPACLNDNERMCRSIKTLRRKESKPTEQEIHDAALQFVRKISGYRVPSRANAPAFEAAVKEVSGSSRRLLNGLAG